MSVYELMFQARFSRISPSPLPHAYVTQSFTQNGDTPFQIQKVNCARAGLLGPDDKGEHLLPFAQVPFKERGSAVF